MESSSNRLMVTLRVIGETIRGTVTGRATGHGERMLLRLDDCLWAAAPLILFRLKRQGYSDCSVVCERRGLTVRFRR